MRLYWTTKESTDPSQLIYIYIYYEQDSPSRQSPIRNRKIV